MSKIKTNTIENVAGNKVADFNNDNAVFDKEFGTGNNNVMRGDAIQKAIQGSGGTANWFRVGSIDGIDSTSGGSLTVMLSNNGDYSNKNRQAVLLQIGQRGTGSTSFVVNVLNRFGITLDPLVFYIKELTDYSFEVWAKRQDYSQKIQATLFGAEKAELLMDSYTEIEPSGLTTTEVIELGKWITPTLLNGWVNFGGTSSDTKYMKDSQGFVHIKGFVKSGTLGTTLFTLPTGYRPDAVLPIATVANDGNTVIAHVDIEANGNVISQSGGNTWFSLNIAPFRAEQ